ncbi:MFS transporter [Alphaproteobacteria bacterium]|nr:MFS transporter [Alphaproteobacteria bacterium]MDC0148503.1 MFS transporter [Alphaproteobacteria bacterium]
MQPTIFSRSLRAYTVGLLTLIYTANYVDRQIVAILLQPIKEEMLLSDTQLGLLSGLAFAIFYATLGIPIAYLADRYSRKKIIVTALTLFSIMTYVCGLAQNYTQLLLARIGVGVGEAGTSPPSHAMITDMYAPSERAAPLSIFALGINIGLFIAFLGGGYINQHYGWRTAFQIVAVPGLFLALLAVFTLRDPPRGMSDKKSDSIADSKPPSMLDVAKHMWRVKSIRQMTIATTLIITIGYGGVAWIPSYLIRIHGMSSIDVGIVLALSVGIGGGLGTAIGGALADRLGKRDIRWNLWIIMITSMTTMPFSIAAYTSDSLFWALLLMIPPVCVAALYFGPHLAMLHTLVRPNMRSSASAISLFIQNIIGLGLGPLSIGLLSDALTPAYGIKALPYAMSIMALIVIWAFVHFWLAARSLRKDIEDANAGVPA